MTDADLAARITALKQAVSKAKAAIEQRRQEADALSKEMAAQSEANAKLQAELDKLLAVAEFDAHWQRVCRDHLLADAWCGAAKNKVRFTPESGHHTR